MRLACWAKEVVYGLVQESQKEARRIPNRGIRERQGPGKTHEYIEFLATSATRRIQGNLPKGLRGLSEAMYGQIELSSKKAQEGR